jgi:tetratricopeptide (TPR) repeat protein
MMLELLMQDWQASKEQTALGIDAMTADLQVREPTGSAYARIFERLTRYLDSTTQNVLNLAAILGHRLNELSMYAIVDLSPGQTITGMADLVGRRILRDGPQGLEFVNELVRAAAYIAVTPTIRHVLHCEIADRLIQQCSSRSDDSGLEIAWHCMRGRRCEEATSYLLRGARHAIRAGALYEGDRSLASVLSQSHLSFAERSEAVLLLAEILQEQGRWEDLLRLLETQRNYGLSLSPAWTRLLTVVAAFHIYGSSPQETAEHVTFLDEVIRSGTDNAIRVAAADLAATLIGTLRDKDRAHLTLEATRSISLTELAPQEVTRLSLAKSRIAFHLGDRKAGLQEMLISLPQIESAQEPSTTAAQFRAGLGWMSCVDGQYQDAVRHLDKGREISLRLGNDALRARMTANLALAHGRIGNYQKQLQFAQESLSLRPPFAEYQELLATYCAVFAKVFLNAPSGSFDLISAADSRIMDALPEWALQAWSLYSADLYLLLGQELRSRASAISGTTERNSVPLVPSFAGIFCRWKAKLATDDSSIEDSLRLIMPLMDDLSIYDALDRAEILASVVFLRTKMGIDSREAESLLQEQLGELPNPVTEQLHRLGILLTSSFQSPMLSSSTTMTGATSPSSTR